MHFEHRPSGKPPTTAYEVYICDDTGKALASIRTGISGITIIAAQASVNIDSATNDNGTVTQIAITDKERQA